MTETNTTSLESAVITMNDKLKAFLVNVSEVNPADVRNDPARFIDYEPDYALTDLTREFAIAKDVTASALDLITMYKVVVQSFARELLT